MDRFVVGEHRIVEPFPFWKVREAFCVVSAVALIALGYQRKYSLAVRRLSFWTGSALAVRTLVFRPVVGQIFRRQLHPHEYGFELADWNAFWPAYDPKDIEINLTNRARVRTRVLNPTGADNGQVVLYCMGNFHTVETTCPEMFNTMRAAGFTVVLYDPPGYGQSSGSRTSGSDGLAVDGVMQYIVSKGFAEESITVVGHSMGADAAVQAALAYAIKHLVLVVPLGSVESVARRNAEKMFGSLGTVGWYASRSALRDYVGGAPDALIGDALARKLTIVEGELDLQMRGGNVVDEADRLAENWDEMHSKNHQARHLLVPGLPHLFNDWHPVWTELLAELAR